MHPHSSERWAAIPGAPEYQVSTLGQVRRRRVFKVGEILTYIDLAPNKSGYVTVWLGKTMRLQPVHRMVLLAFEGEPPTPTDGSRLSYAHHLDHDKTNNRLENLRWVSSLQHGHHHALYPADDPHPVRSRG